MNGSDTIYRKLSAITAFSVIAPIFVLAATRLAVRESASLVLSQFENVTIFVRPNVTISVYPPTIYTSYRLMRPVPMLQNYEPIFLEGSHKYQILDESLFSIPSLITLNDTIVSTDSVFFYNNTIYLPDVSCHPMYWKWEPKEHDAIVIRYTTYDSVISVGHQHSSDFGHWMLEVLPSFIAVPQKIRDMSYLALPSMPKHVEMSLQFFGFNISRVIIGKQTYMFARKLYTIYSTSCGDLNQWLLSNFRSHVVLRLNLDQAPPTRYVLFNRKKKESRYLTNFPDILEACRFVYPKVKFEEGVYYKTFQEQAKYFNEMKLIFAVHGSLLANIIFMQELSFVVELQMETILQSFYYASVLTGKILICCRDTSISYRKIQKNDPNITKIVQAIGVGIQ